MTRDTADPTGGAMTVERAGTLDLIGVDFRLELGFGNGYRVQLESECTFTDRSGSTAVVDPDRKDSLLPVLRLFGAELVRSSTENGVLTLIFDGGDTLVAGPDAEFESWQVSGPKGRPTRTEPPTGSTSTGTGTEGDRG